MLNSVRFVNNWRCFKFGDEIVFRSGVNLLVGDQGSGKSSLLAAIASKAALKKYPCALDWAKNIEIDADPTPVSAVDFEQQNPRVKSRMEQGDSPFLIASRFMSHGQSHQNLLKSIIQFDSGTVCLDEPDMSLSIRSCLQLANDFKTCARNGCQVLAAIHNPIVIQQFELVYSLEHRIWMSSNDFIASQMKE